MRKRRTCSDCIHLKVCKLIFDRELDHWLNKALDRIAEMWDHEIDTSELEDAFNGAMEEFFAENCDDYQEGQEE